MKIIQNQRDPQEWHEFVALLKQAIAEGREDALFSMLLTADERSSLGMRVQIVRLLLNEQYSQREIQQLVNTSAATITRGSNMLKTMDADTLTWVHQQLNG